MDDRQKQQRPRILLFDANGNPLIIQAPQKKQPIGFKVEDIKPETLISEVK